ncbi:MAG: LuxR C-terminal-related transcriptional regulator, partial [Anaerolineales bacterium]|nr:LuxR C-terminal-related transcriptional regulator [Anaerolineales bacterium]
AGRDREGALAALAKALDRAAPEGYVRTFVDFGPPMAELLRDATAQGIHAQYAGMLISQFYSPDTISNQTDLVEPLSDRELEVLTLLTTHLTGPEIADHLHISNNTLKTHTKNIYGKLGVNSRSDAVAKAQSANLI